MHHGICKGQNQMYAKQQYVCVSVCACVPACGLVLIMSWGQKNKQNKTKKIQQECTLNYTLL